MTYQGNWYLKLQDLTTGPYPSQQIIDWLLLKQIKPKDSIYQSNEKKWLPIDTIPEFTPTIQKMPKNLDALLGGEELRYTPPPVKKGISWREKRKKFFTPYQKEVKPPNELQISIPEEIRHGIQNNDSTENAVINLEKPSTQEENVWTILDDIKNYEDKKKSRNSLKKQEEEFTPYLENDSEQSFVKIIFYLFVVLAIGFAAFSFYSLNTRNAAIIERIEVPKKEERKKEGDLPESIPVNPPAPTLLPPVRPQRE